MVGLLIGKQYDTFDLAILAGGVFRGGERGYAAFLRSRWATS
jgi:hypothetical protein